MTNSTALIKIFQGTKTLQMLYSNFIVSWISLQPLLQSCTSQQIVVDIGLKCKAMFAPPIQGKIETWIFGIMLFLTLAQGFIKFPDIFFMSCAGKEEKMMKRVFFCSISTNFDKRFKRSKFGDKVQYFQDSFAWFSFKVCIVLICVILNSKVHAKIFGKHYAPKNWFTS